jgi:V8-like Glu-specific endopeptidase
MPDRRHWDISTAGEALIALGEIERSKVWFKDYVNHPDIDAFSLAGTIRQLRELWRLGDSDDGNQLLMPLQARLLELPGGNFTIPNADLQKLADVPQASYEKILGDTGAKTYTWMKKGFDIARSVALVRQNGRGIGTGFIVRGSDLHAKFGEDLFVLTNSHVVSEPPVHDAASPDQVTVTFEILATEGSEHQRDVTEYEISKIVWQSPPEMHDAALLRLTPDIPNKLVPISFSPALPVLEDGKPQRVYVIGHPRGGEISFSYEDNELLDYEVDLALAVDDPSPCRIHYHAPTEPGSSGSPVFNASWRSIGLHHKGGTAMPKLNGKTGLYGANEAISIGSIKKALAKIVR